MLIDWFTVTAQIINFIILVWVMNRWVYTPLLAALDARERQLAETAAAAAEKLRQVARTEEELDARRRDLDTRRQELLADATRQAEAEGARLIEQARRVATEKAGRLVESMQSAARRQCEVLSRRMEEEILAVVRHVLEELASTRLEDHLVTAFLRRLGELAPEQRGVLAEALRSSAQPPRLLCAMELGEEQKRVLALTLGELFGFAGQLAFEKRPELIAGIELHTGSQRVIYSVAEHLRRLEETAGRVLGELWQKEMAAVAPLTTKEAREPSK